MTREERKDIERLKRAMEKAHRPGATEWEQYEGVSEALKIWAKYDYLAIQNEARKYTLVVLEGLRELAETAEDQQVREQAREMLERCDKELFPRDKPS